MRVGNVFSRVCLSMCLSVPAITFEPIHIGTSFLVWRCILTSSRSSLSIKVKVMCKNDYFFKLIIPFYVATGH